MQSSQRETVNSSGLDLIFFRITNEALLQLSSGAMLVALLGAKAYSEMLVTIGEASEEILRGDRLPVLDFPVAAKSE